ncbi:MAG: hypothetical protein QOH12_3353 [Solirubrobacteraceae bacterium]|nr:hypothetical protein [Solirubrobacteraceae bacterium]
MEHRPERILGDTAYRNGVVRSELAERGVDVLPPVPEGGVVEGLLNVDEMNQACEPPRSDVRCLPAAAAVLPERAASTDPAL